MPKVTIHLKSGTNLISVPVLVNGIKKEFPVGREVEVEQPYLEALRESHWDVTEHDSAEGSAEAGEELSSSPAQQPGVPDRVADTDQDKAKPVMSEAPKGDKEAKPADAPEKAAHAADGDQDQKEPAKSPDPAKAAPKPAAKRAGKAKK